MLEYTKTILQVWIVKQRHREEKKMYATKTLILFIIGGILLGAFYLHFIRFPKPGFFYAVGYDEP